MVTILLDRNQAWCNITTHTFFPEMSDAIPNNGTDLCSLFLATIYSTTDARLLFGVTGCDWHMMVRLYGSNVPASQRSQQLALPSLHLLLVILVLLDCCSRCSRPASQIISCTCFPTDDSAYTVRLINNYEFIMIYFWIYHPLSVILINIKYQNT